MFVVIYYDNSNSFLTESIKCYNCKLITFHIQLLLRTDLKKNQAGKY